MTSSHIGSSFDDLLREEGILEGEPARPGSDEESTMTRPAIHPGAHIADELEALATSASTLARELGIPANRITGIIRGRSGITADTAIRLALWSGTSPELWMNLQKTYELRLAETEHGDEIRRSVTPRWAA